MTENYLSCAEAEENIDAYIDGELLASDAERVAEHLGKCESCRNLYNDIIRLKNDVRESVPDMPNDLHETIIRAVRAEKSAEIKRKISKKIRIFGGAGIAAVFCLIVAISPFLNGQFWQTKDASLGLLSDEVVYMEDANNKAEDILFADKVENETSASQIAPVETDMTGYIDTSLLQSVESSSSEADCVEIYNSDGIQSEELNELVPYACSAFSNLYAENIYSASLPMNIATQYVDEDGDGFVGLVKIVSVQSNITDNGGEYGDTDCVNIAPQGDYWGAVVIRDGIAHFVCFDADAYSYDSVEQQVRTIRFSEN